MSVNGIEHFEGRPPAGTAKRDWLRRECAAVLMALCAQAGVAQAQATAPAIPGEATAGIEEITVTARRREESLQETPISITAFTAETLAERQVVTTQDLGRFVPNLVTSLGQSVSGNSSAGSYFIRGIGQIDFLLNTDPGVGVYVDGIYIARSMGSIMGLLDPERIEVLRGPQGTLFGRNTIGGAVSVTTRRPDDELRAGLELTTGSRDRFDARATVNVPLTDRLFANGTVLWRNQDGYVHRVTDDSWLGEVDSVAARSALRFLATDALTLDLAFDVVRERGTAPASNVVQINETAVFPGIHNSAFVGPPCVPPPGSTTNPACFNAQHVPGDLFVERGAFASRQETDVFGVSLTAEWQLSEFLAVKSITGYRDTDALGNRDGDHTPILIQNTRDTWSHEQFSQELQLLGTSLEGRLDWIVGAYYFEEEGTNLSFVDFAPASFQSGGSVDNDNYAFFGQLTFAVTDRLNLTAGLRWTDDSKSFTPDQFATVDRIGLFPPGSVPGFRLVPPVRVKTNESELTPMVNLSYAWTDGFMTYFNYTQGFKSGGFTQRIFPPLPTVPSFGPESVDAYEAGFKWDALQRRLRLNGAVYYTDYSDLQVQVLEGVQPLIRNAAGAEISGFELEVALRPVPNLEFNAGVGHTNADYTELDATVLATGVTLDSKFPQVPAWTGVIGASYEHALPGGFLLVPRIDWTYQSQTFMDAANTASMRQEGYGLLGMGLRIDGGPGRFWSVEVFGRNLTDETYFTGGFADLNVQGYAEVALAPEREWGVTLRLRY